MQGFLRPRERVVTQVPAFPPLYTIPKILGCEVIRWESDIEKSWTLDLDFLRDQLREDTRLVIVSFPHNPTGYSPSIEEFHKLIEIVRECDAYLLCVKFIIL